LFFMWPYVEYLNRLIWFLLSLVATCRIPGGFCQPQASLRNTTAGDTAPAPPPPKSKRSLPPAQAANQRRCHPHVIVCRWQRARSGDPAHFQPRF
jgi:hypothetical protein